MSKEQESLKTEIYGLLKSRGLNPVSKDSAGDTVPIPEEAEVFEFMFSKDGVDYGKVWVTLDGLRQLVIYFGKDVADSPKNGSADSNSWSQLHRALSRFATSRQLSFELSDQSNLEADMAKREHTKREEQVNEGYYPIGKNASGNNNIPSVTMRIQHTRPIEEGEQRFRNIARIFVENQDGERILLPTNKPGLARTYVRHIAEGGKPNDERWNHLNNLCEEYQKMAGFVRATRNGQFNESAQSLVNEGINHYQKLRETLGKLQGKRGYNEYFESYTPALMEDEEQVDLSEMFMSSSLDPRIESVMPILSKLSRNITETKKDMEEVIALGEWADSLTELSNEKLGQYKKAASADASAADAAGNMKRGDKRFKGIVKATVKQFDNDIKKHYDGKEQGVAEGLGYSQDPEQAKWYHEGRRAFKGGTTGGLIQDIAKKHGCPPEWVKAFHAGYQDQEGWGKEDVAEDDGFNVVSNYDNMSTTEKGNKLGQTYTSTSVQKNPTTGQQKSLASWDYTDPKTGKNYSGSTYIDPQGNADTEKNYQESTDPILSRIKKLSGL